MMSVFHRGYNFEMEIQTQIRLFSKTLPFFSQNGGMQGVVELTGYFRFIKLVYV